MTSGHELVYAPAQPNINSFVVVFALRLVLCYSPLPFPSPLLHSLFTLSLPPSLLLSLSSSLSPSLLLLHPPFYFLFFPAPPSFLHPFLQNNSHLFTHYFALQIITDMIAPGEAHPARCLTVGQQGATPNWNNTIMSRLLNLHACSHLVSTEWGNFFLRGITRPLGLPHQLKPFRNSRPAIRICICCSYIVRNVL